MIETERLKLIPVTIEVLESFERDEKEFAEKLGVTIADGWLVFPEAIPYTLKLLREMPEIAADWSMYFFIHKTDEKLIGNGGFKGAPDEFGMVEIGYAIAPEYRNCGLATEASAGMIGHAFSYSDVKIVDAHTLAEENASVKVLQKCGMSKIAEKHGTEDGDIWQWRILRDEFVSENEKN